MCNGRGHINQIILEGRTNFKIDACIIKVSYQYTFITNTFIMHSTFEMDIIINSWLYLLSIP